MTKPNVWGLRHPKPSVVSAVVTLTEAERAASDATLTLRETSALLTHLRNALAGALYDRMEMPTGRCAICAAGLSTDRALLSEAAQALRHVRDCGACGEDSWTACASGGHHAELTLTALEQAVASDPRGSDV
jgi:hypothetical protein